MTRETDSADTVAPRRIIVTVDIGSQLPATLELAAALAQAQQGALHGLFVEDEDLLNVAGLPFSQEVPLSCGRPRALDDRSLERALERASRAFRHSLERQAERLSLSWSFSTVRGRKRALQLGEEESADILVIAQPSRRRAPPHPRVHRILLLPDHSPLVLPALAVLLRRHPDLPVELKVLAEEGQRDDPELARLLEEYPDVKAGAVDAAQLQSLLESRVAPLDCVLVSRNIEAARLRRVLSLASCPVIIVS